MFVLMTALTALAFVGCAGKTEAPAENSVKDDATATVAEVPAEKIVWKFGHLANEDHLWNKTAIKFAELVSEKTNGQIEVKIYPNEQLGSEMDNITGIQTGTVDLTITGESLQNWAPKAALLAIPYAITSSEQMDAVINGDLGAEIEAQITENVGLIPLYYHKRAPRNLTANIPVRTPEDVAGLKMRVPNVPIFIDAWSAAGANPQVMAFSEVFTGLQQGVIGAQENPYDLIVSASFYEVQDYVNETEHVSSWVYVVVGEKQFNALTPELQEAVMASASEAQAWGQAEFEASAAEYKQKCIDEGMTIIDDVDKAAFQEVMMPAIKKSLSDEQIDLLNRIIEAGK
ncbi:MAG: TRAP transporter substrate-binding protein [Clostridia bacterium]|nr:TRAP transporter substrate-binding protein [Clostridia bacterium]